MKLGPLETRAQQMIEATDTGVVLVIKFAGKIVGIKAEFDAKTIDKAKGLGHIWGAGVPRETVVHTQKIQEPMVPPKIQAESKEVRTKE